MPGFAERFRDESREARRTSTTRTWPRSSSSSRAPTPPRSSPSWSTVSRLRRLLERRPARRRKPRCSWSKSALIGLAELHNSASCTATSARRTSSSTPTASPKSSTSASRADSTRLAAPAARATSRPRCGPATRPTPASDVYAATATLLRMPDRRRVRRPCSRPTCRRACAKLITKNLSAAARRPRVRDAGAMLDALAPGRAEQLRLRLGGDRQGEAGRAGSPQRRRHLARPLPPVPQDHPAPSARPTCMIAVGLTIAAGPRCSWRRPAGCSSRASTLPRRHRHRRHSARPAHPDRPIRAAGAVRPRSGRQPTRSSRRGDRGLRSPAARCHARSRSTGTRRTTTSRSPATSCSAPVARDRHDLRPRLHRARSGRAHDLRLHGDRVRRRRQPVAGERHRLRHDA